MTRSSAKQNQSSSAWRRASKRLADEAQGNVAVVVAPDKMKPGAIIFDELPKLANNLKVTGVTLMHTSGKVLSKGSPEAAPTVLKGIVK